MLVNIPLPGHSGITVDQLSNAGSVENKGVELALSYRNSDRPFKYEVSVNFSKINNEVTGLGKGGEAISSADFRAISRRDFLPVAI